MSNSINLEGYLRALIRDELRALLHSEVLPELDKLSDRLTPPITSSPDDLLPAEEVARICAVEASTVRKWMRKDGLEWIAVSARGRQKRVRRRDLELFLQRRATSLSMEAALDRSIEAEVERVLAKHNNAR